MPRIRELKTNYLVKDLSHYIEDSLRENGMKQKDLAEELGITQQNLSYKLRHYSFTFEDFLKIMEVLKPDEQVVIRLVKSWE